MKYFTLIGLALSLASYGQQDSAVDSLKILNAEGLVESLVTESGNVVHKGYGVGDKEAADLGKTDSGYLWGVATDGTMIEVDPSSFSPQEGIIASGSNDVDTLIAGYPDRNVIHFHARGANGEFTFTTPTSLFVDGVASNAVSPVTLPEGATGYIYSFNDGANQAIVYQTSPTVDVRTVTGPLVDNTDPQNPIVLPQTCFVPEGPEEGYTALTQTLGNGTNLTTNNLTSQPVIFSGVTAGEIRVESGNGPLELNFDQPVNVTVSGITDPALLNPTNWSFNTGAAQLQDRILSNGVITYEAGALDGQTVILNSLFDTPLGRVVTL